MEDMLRTLVGFQSTLENKLAITQLLHFTSDYLRNRGMHIRESEDAGFASIVATTHPDAMTPKVMFVLHADVVPAAREMFTMTSKDGKYFGRGVHDMKFAIAACLLLVDKLKAQLSEYDFGIMVTTDEEQGGMHGAGYLVEQGYRPQVCIVPDGGEQWHIETFAKGAQWIELEAKGIAAHASRPWEGEHAVHKLLSALHEIRQAYPNQTARRKTVLSVGTIRGGEAPNQSAKHATAMLDIRTASMRDHDEVYPRINEICERYDVRATQLTKAPPCINDPQDEHIAAFRTIMTDVLGQEFPTSYSYAATDARYFTAKGIPCVIVQPPGGDHHSAEEWTTIEGCDQFYEVICRYITERAKNT